MILAIKTNEPTACIGLYKINACLEMYEWTAHRQLAETIHSEIKHLLIRNNVVLADVKAIVVYKGPGSFTGLRIGVSVANSLASALQISIIGVSGTDWIEEGLSLYTQGKVQKMVEVEYGSDAVVTQPRK